MHNTPSPDFCHPLPAAPDTEAAMLSCYLQWPGTHSDHPTTGAEYHGAAHRGIHAAMLEMIAACLPIDLLTLTQHLRDSGKLNAVGGVASVSRIAILAASPVLAGSYRETLLEKSRLRAIALTAAAVASAACLGGADPAELSERLQCLLTALARASSTGSAALGMSELIPDAITRMEERHANKGKLRGISSGLGMLDRLTGGWRPGQMIVIAAREKEGKSSLARQFALEAAVNRSEPIGVAIFSHEMGREEITDALIATRARVPGNRIADGMFAEGDFPKVSRAVKDLADAPIIVFDEADSSVLQFRANARRAVRELGCGLIIVDYLQLMGGGNEDNRERAIAAVSRNIKLAAKELEIPIIVLSQLNKSGDTRESMSIQQDLDRLIIIEHEKTEDDAEEGKAWIKVKLSRGGPKGSAPVTWRPSITRFDPLAGDDQN